LCFYTHLKKKKARHQWLMPIILATWEAEIKENYSSRPA
jgi:hypothetical protein